MLYPIIVTVQAGGASQRFVSWGSFVTAHRIDDNSHPSTYPLDHVPYLCASMELSSHSCLASSFFHLNNQSSVQWHRKTLLFCGQSNFCVCHGLLAQYKPPVKRKPALVRYNGGAHGLLEIVRDGAQFSCSFLAMNKSIHAGRTFFFPVSFN